MSPNWLVVHSLTFNSSSMLDTLFSRACFSCKDEEKVEKDESSRGQQAGRRTRDEVKPQSNSYPPL